MLCYNTSGGDHGEATQLSAALERARLLMIPPDTTAALSAVISSLLHRNPALRAYPEEMLSRFEPNVVSLGHQNDITSGGSAAHERGASSEEPQPHSPNNASMSSRGIQTLTSSRGGAEDTRGSVPWEPFASPRTEARKRACALVRTRARMGLAPGRSKLCACVRVCAHPSRPPPHPATRPLTRTLVHLSTSGVTCAAGLASDHPGR